MSLPDAARQQVRRRAGFACEFCGVTEADAGGLLTIDHSGVAHGSPQRGSL